ncbi:MAG TPA: hypothetical protein VG389_25275 [Myxococcota bacterium]|nr:hypothetical protein [Myxococcota bacterium]
MERRREKRQRHERLGHAQPLRRHPPVVAQHPLDVLRERRIPEVKVHRQAPGRQQEPALFVIVRRADARQTAKTRIHFLPIDEHSTDMMRISSFVNIQMNIQ